MVRIEKTPSDVALAGNPLAFTVVGENAYTAGGKLRAYATLSFSRELENGDSFTLSVNQNAYEFLVRAYSSLDSYENARYMVVPDGASRIDIVAIAGYLGKHPELGGLFDFSANVDKGEIEMTAKGKDRYQLSAEGSRWIQGGEAPDISCNQLLYGGLASLQDGYAMHQRVFVPDISALPVAELLISPDSEGRNRNDIGEFLHPYFSFDFHLPAKEAVYEQPRILLAYRCDFWESYTGFLSKLTTSKDLWAIPGRRNPFSFVKAGNSIGYDFLSNFNGTKTLYRGIPEKLFYLAQAGYDYSVMAHVNGKDIALESNLTAIRPTVYEINAEPELVEALAGTEGLGEYNIFLSRRQTGSSLPRQICSSVRKFRVGERPASLHAFLFANEYGVFETACLEGLKSVNLDISRTFLPSEEKEAATKPLRTRAELAMKVGSGFVPKGTWQWLNEMQRSLQVYELLEEEGIAAACTLTNTQSREIKETELFCHEFEYQYLQEGSFPFEAETTLSIVFDSTFDNTFN